MTAALALLLAFQLAGETLRVALHLPVPGPVIGMALLLVYLIIRPEGPSTELRNTAGGLLQNLSLLFVPAGTGVTTDTQWLDSHGVSTGTETITRRGSPATFAYRCIMSR